MSYYISKSKQKYFHRNILICSFEILERYNKQLQSFCREKPHISLQPAEIYSDLLLDRFPHLILKCSISTEDMQKILHTDLSAARDPSKLDYNLDEIVAQSYRTKADKELAVKQFLYLSELAHLVKKEKKLLAYLRSCIRRLKISYSQHCRRTAAREVNLPEDQTLDSYPAANTPLNGQNQKDADEFLELGELSKPERQILIDILITKLTFQELAEKLKISRQTAARRYQEALLHARRGLRSYGRRITKAEDIFNVKINVR